ncbi:MAG TPA: DUF1501 domain-containing protein [Pirellulaceae bacterium]|nr:DUF1501 domain-containing protein [Pirellulaceae bacterium]
MLTFGHAAARLCQGVTRRHWLRCGGLSSLGLMLPELLSARAGAAEQTASREPQFGRAKSCIVCFLFGAPAHQDIWDLKPEAADDVRGPFLPISSSVPGTLLSEHIPRTAKLAHQFALVRSVTHPDSTHTVAMHYMLTGQRHRRPATNPTNLPDDFPCFGAAVSRFRPSITPLPSGISLNAPGNEIPSGHIFPGFFAGFLGHGYDPMFVTANPASKEFDPFPVAGGAPRERVRERQTLVEQLDGLRRRFDTDESVRSAGSFQDKALSLIGSPSAVRAFDLSREKQSVRDQFGMTPFGQGCLLARRLVESGVRLVTVNWARDYQAGIADHWDTHQRNFVLHKEKLLPAFDQAYSALLTDLDERGLLDETLVVVLAEFGRTPKINSNAGRDHWPGCFSITLAGAGIRGGLVHGASDRIAAYPSRDPVSPEEVAATIYHALGIPLRTEVIDHSGRPMPLATAQPLRALFGA